MNLGDIIGNVASGGLLGLLGNACSFGMQYLKDRQTHGFRMAELEAQAKADAARTAGEIAVASEKGAADAFTASIAAEAAIRGESRWVTNGRACVRPVLTLVLLLLTALQWFTTTDADLRAYIATNVVVVAVAAVTWWFGQRQLDRATIQWGAGTINGSVSRRLTK